VIENGRVYVTFGSPGTACLDSKTGKKLWERTDFVCNHFRGAGSSPTIFKNDLIMNFDGSDFQFVVGLDKMTGKTIWKTDRSLDFKDLTPEGKPSADGDWRKAFSTPLVHDFGEGPILISHGSKAVYAYVPETGKELWHVEEQKTHSGSGRPIVGHGIIFVSMGHSKSELWAIRPGGSGDADSRGVEGEKERSHAFVGGAGGGFDFHGMTEASRVASRQKPETRFGTNGSVANTRQPRCTGRVAFIFSARKELQP